MLACSCVHAQRARSSERPSGLSVDPGSAEGADPDAADTLEVPGIAGRDLEAMLERRCGDQSIR